MWQPHRSADREPLSDYKKIVRILDQGTAGACAGFGLATVANYLLRNRKVWPDKTAVSPWMLYAMAQGGAEVKFFYPTADQAASFGERAYGSGNYTVVGAEFPANACEHLRTPLFQ
jgi:hypothetical protein